MKRIIHEVPRWSIFLHREARGLGPVETDDQGELRFQDELFEQLYSGETTPLPDVDRDPELAGWAERVHAACEQLPDFQRLAAECRGDADAAAAAVEVLVKDLRPEMSEADLRRAARSSCTKAACVVEELRDAAEGLHCVSLGRPGEGSSLGTGSQSPRTRSLAAHLRQDPRLRHIAKLAGRFRRVAAAKRRSRVRHGADEVSDIEQGADLGRLLPVELARLNHPRLRTAMLRDLLEHRCLQHALAGAEPLGRGPLVVCIDKSGSMEGEADVWATAAALALLDTAQREARWFALLGFDGAVKSEHVVGPGSVLPWEALFTSCAGGTRIDAVIARGLEIVEHHGGALSRADLILITDGASDATRAAELRARARALGVSIFGCAIAVAPSALDPWCDEVTAVGGLDVLDDQVATLLFGA